MNYYEFLSSKFRWKIENLIKSFLYLKFNKVITFEKTPLSVSNNAKKMRKMVLENKIASLLPK